MVSLHNIPFDQNMMNKYAVKRIHQKTYQFRILLENFNIFYIFEALVTFHFQLKKNSKDRVFKCKISLQDSRYRVYCE
jgi:hypothetical protein